VTVIVLIQWVVGIVGLRYTYKVSKKSSCRRGKENSIINEVKTKRFSKGGPTFLNAVVARTFTVVLGIPPGNFENLRGKTVEFTLTWDS
jgi:hypothetical protein